MVDLFFSFLKRILVVFCLILVFQSSNSNRFFWTNLWSFQGTELASFKFQFSTPIVLQSKDDLNSSDAVVYGDKVLRPLTFPFLIGMNLGYIFAFDKKHSLLANTSLNYSDDPVNFLFDSQTASKLNTPSFTSKNLNVSFLLRYGLKLSSELSIAPFFSTILNFTKDKSFDFSENIYNFYSFNTGIKLVSKSIELMRFDLGLGYNFNYYPNGDLSSRSASDGQTSYPKTTKNYQTISGNFGYFYRFAEAMSLSTGVNLAGDFYLDQPIHNGDLNSPEITDTNEEILRVSANLNFFFGFFKRDGYNLLDLSIGYLFKYYDSNYVELLVFSQGQAGDRASSLGAALQVGSQFVYYEKGFKDYLANVGSVSTLFNFGKKYQLSLGYSLTAKNFLEAYGRYGGSHSVYGAYKDEKRFDLSHIISLGFVYRSEDRTRSINPYVGLLLESSNDAIALRNRHIYFIGLKGVYEI